MHTYSIITNEKMFEITIISVNGMTWKVDVSTLSLIIPNYTGQVFKMSVMFETQINLQILAYMYILFIYSKNLQQSASSE